MELEAWRSLMLKEWLELESSAGLSRDGFGCYPRRHLAAELRSAGGSCRRRNGDVIAKVSAAVRVALFPPVGEAAPALHRSFSRKLRVGLWKRRRGSGRRVASCSEATASCRRDGSSPPAMSPRRRCWEGDRAGAGAGGRQRHETEEGLHSFLWALVQSNLTP